MTAESGRPAHERQTPTNTKMWKGKKRAVLAGVKPKWMDVTGSGRVKGLDFCAQPAN